MPKRIPVYIQNLDTHQIILARSKTEACKRYLGRSYNHFLDQYNFLDTDCSFEMRHPKDRHGNPRGELPLGRYRFHTTNPNL